jgi:hypothetical protein
VREVVADKTKIFILLFGAAFYFLDIFDGFLIKQIATKTIDGISGIDYCAALFKNFDSLINETFLGMKGVYFD